MFNADLNLLILGIIMLAPRIVGMECGFPCPVMMVIMPMEMVVAVIAGSKVDLAVTEALPIPQTIALDLSPLK